MIVIDISWFIICLDLFIIVNKCLFCQGPLHVDEWSGGEQLKYTEGLGPGGSGDSWIA